MAYDIPSVSELEAVQLLNKHYAEVITSKEDGIASGSDITQTTNPITGVVRRTLYKILDDMDVEHDAQISAHESEHDSQIATHETEFTQRLLAMAFTPVGTFTAGATLTDARQTLLWEVSQGGDGHYYSWSGTFPKAVTAGSSPSPIEAGSWVDRTDDALRDEIRETVFQTTKRSYAEAGYNLVDGSFEAGGTLVNANDVLLQERTGKAFSGSAGPVAAGTNPASGGFVDKSEGLLRHELATSNGATKVGTSDGGSVQDFIDAQYTTVAELATGKFHVGQYVRLTDRAMGLFLVQSGGTADGYVVLDAGNGNTAILDCGSEIYAEWCGAKGDSSTNNTPCVQSAINYLSSIGGGLLTFQAGGFAFDATVNLYNSIYIKGMGVNTYPHNVDGCYLFKRFNGNLFEFYGTDQSVFEDGWGIRDIVLFGDGANYTGKALYVNEGTGFQLHNVVATRFTDNVFHFFKCGTHQITHCRPIETFGVAGVSGIYEEESGDWHIDSCDFGNTPLYRDKVWGIRARLSTGRISNNKIFFTQYAVYNDQSSLQVTDNTFNDNYTRAVRSNGFESVYVGNLIYNTESVNLPDANFIAFEDLAGRSAFVGNVVKHTPGRLLYGFHLNNISKSIVTGNICNGADALVINEIGGRKNTIVGNHFGSGVSNNLTQKGDLTNTIQDSMQVTAYSSATTAAGFGVGVKYSAVFGADGGSPTDLGYVDYSFSAFNQSKITYSMQFGGKQPYMTVEARKVSTNYGVNLGGVPLTQSNGDIWHDSASGKLMVRLAGVNREVALV